MSDTLVDDAVADFRQTVDVSLARTVVAAFDGIVEQTLHAVAVVRIVLRSVDAALCSDAVGTTRTVLDAEHLDIETHLAK